MKKIVAAILFLLLFGCLSNSSDEQNSTPATEKVNVTKSAQIVDIAENLTEKNDEIIENVTEQAEQENNSIGKTGENTTGQRVVPIVGENDMQDFVKINDDEGRIRAYYFFKPGCWACEQTKPELAAIEGNCTNANYTHYDLSTDEGWAAYQEFARQYNLSKERQLVPTVLVKQTILIGNPEIPDNLPRLISCDYAIMTNSTNK